MAQGHLFAILLLVPFACHFIPGVVRASATFTLVNRCQYTVWPGILSGAGSPSLSTTGFALQTGESKTIQAPTSWGGRFWGRTLCSENSTGKFSCVTGDCGSGKLECSGGNAAPPATLAEFKLDGDGGKDFYNVSLVDGYNLPLVVVRQGGSGDNCTTTGCTVVLKGVCVSELKVTSSNGGENVACKSACEAFGDAQYCKPSSYSQVFKSASPRAHGYAYVDKTSTFTRTGADYIITFCPSPSTSQKSSSGNQTPATNGDNNSSSVNGTMAFDGAASALDDSSAAPMCMHVFRSQGIAATAAIVSAIWRLSQHF